MSTLWTSRSLSPGEAGQKFARASTRAARSNARNQQRPLNPVRVRAPPKAEDHERTRDLAKLIRPLEGRIGSSMRSPAFRAVGYQTRRPIHQALRPAESARNIFGQRHVVKPTGEAIRRKQSHFSDRRRPARSGRPAVRDEPPFFKLRDRQAGARFSHRSRRPNSPEPPVRGRHSPP